MREKGLTKISFEALVRAVLVGTDSNTRLPRGEIKRRVRSLLSGHPAAQVDIYVDGALNRLARRIVKHRIDKDEFSLSREEVLRYNDFLTKSAVAEQDLKREISVMVLSAKF